MGADTIYQQLRGHLAYLKLAAAADALAPALEAAEREKPEVPGASLDRLINE